MGYREGANLVLNFKYPYQHFNRIKNHWHQSDPVSALFDAQPGMIASDSDDEKLYHFTGQSPGFDEILQENYSFDKIPRFLGVDLWSNAYHHIIRASEAEGLAGADLRIGLDETLRSLIICDRGDIGVDFGLTAEVDPSLIIFNAAATHRLRIQYNSMNANAGMTWEGTYLMFQLAGGQRSGGDAFFFSDNGGAIFLTDTNAEQAWARMDASINQTLTAGYVGILLNVVESSLGDASAGAGYNALMDLRVATVTQFGIQNDGKIMTNQTAAATTLGSVTDKIPIYDGTGTLVGYIPIYDAIT